MEILPFKSIKKHRVKWIFTCTFLLLIASGVYFKDIANFPIRTVSIEGDYAHISRDEIKSRVMPYVMCRFFSVDIARIKRVVAKDAWVASTMVWRIWPNTVVIYITEKKPVVVWNEKGMITAQGSYFEVGAIPPNLPILYGHDGDRDAAFLQFQAFKQLLATISLQIQTVTSDGTHAWQLVLQNGSKLILGNKNPTQRLEEFVKVYPKVFKNKLDRLDYVDLRYVNGMAVKWKQNS